MASLASPVLLVIDVMSLARVGSADSIAFCSCSIFTVVEGAAPPPLQAVRETASRQTARRESRAFFIGQPSAVSTVVVSTVVESLVSLWFSSSS